MAEDFRCATAARVREDELAGTASTVRAFLLVEHPGPWGVDALRDARLPAGLGDGLAATGRRAGVRVLLVRRPDRSRAAGVRVFAAHTGDGRDRRPWLEATVLQDVAGCLDLDLAAIGEGRRPGWEPRDDPLLAVCTHGRHDACCAERGRPLVQALCATHPDETWEVSHIGGDRFAANLLVLPHGLYYGRVDAGSAAAVADATHDGRVVVALLRGRSSLSMPVQAAEVALRRELGVDRIDAVRPAGSVREDDRVTAAFEVDGRVHEVVVRVSLDPQQQLTCRAERDSSPWRFEVLSVGL